MQGKTHEIPIKDLLACTEEPYGEEFDSKCEWKHVFCLFTLRRTFRLYAQTHQAKKSWIESINKIIENNDL